MKRCLIVLTTLFVLLTGFQLSAQEDPYLWLEKVQGKKALEWVKKQNDITTAQLKAVPGFKAAYDTLLEALNADDRIPKVQKKGKYLYNHWQDATHVRGIYQRTTLEEYRKKNPQWETILDLDALAKKEKENWVFKGFRFLYPGYQRALVYLSRGGGDAVVVREFDMNKRAFVKDGFYLKEAKHRVSWIDKDRLFVGTNFGEGSFTKSGYPRFVKIWKRGTPLKEAKTVLEVKETSVWAFGRRMHDGDGRIDLVADGKSFWKHVYYVLEKGKLRKLDLPQDTVIARYFKKQLLLQLKSDLNTGKTTFKQGSVIAGKVADILAGKKKFQLLMEPGERLSIGRIQTTKNMVLLPVLDNVTGKLYQFTQDKNGTWHKTRVKTEDNGSLRINNVNNDDDTYFITYQNFLTPESFYMVSGKNGKIEKLKSAPKRFDAASLTVKQYHAKSKDGTRIPYFIVMPKDLKLNGQNPTLLYGYGGFRISMTPRYAGARGKVWFERGGVYVVANIRGGGEFGPKWHKAALLKNRLKAYEDFIAVAEDLVKRKITSPAKLGIQGGSNGGLLVGAVFVMRPDLFNAVACAVPLLDMKRYTKLLAGASWAAEYGDPDKPDMWEYIKTYSPYQNVKKGATYPKVLFTTSTRDDRVHPGHARKMAAKMMGMGHEVFLYENMEGGHGAAANNKQRAFMRALAYAYLYKMLMGK
jgi:prolyl oligopeptidase